MLYLKPVSRFECLFLIGVLGVVHNRAFAASFTESVFATGGAEHSTQPTSVAYGNGSVWVTYGNNAPTTNYSGAGSIVQYSATGAVQNTYSLAGSLGGLKYNPNTGQFWLLQGQSAYSQLSIIDPGAKTISSYAFKGPSDYDPGTRAFDDVAFLGNKVFLSETNPRVWPEVIVQLDNSSPVNGVPETMTTVLNVNGLLATDPRQLNSTPNGGLILTGSTDDALTFVTNPGQGNQTATSLQLVAAPGTTMGNAGDALYAGASAGTFYLTDEGTNIIYAVTATGLNPASLFVNVGNEFGSVDPLTGVVTPILFGTDLSGMTFVPDAGAAPEPGTLALGLSGLALAAVAGLRRRRARRDCDTR